MKESKIRTWKQKCFKRLTKLRAGLDLGVVYFILLGVCIFFVMSGQTTDPAVITINAGMFAIVGAVFVYAINRLSILEEISDELNDAISKIISDAKAYPSVKLLWGFYRQNPDPPLFQEGRVSELYTKYCEEMTRYEDTAEENFRCDIEDFINQGFIDSVSKKSILNSFPGIMTGLGILGTFLGLSFGLNFFNTGSSEEIMSSIPRLMEGIKVAFHTSVYGMVFSMVFNAVYRGEYEYVYGILEEFLTAFEKHVIGDPQRYNASATQMIIESLPEKIDQALSHHFDRLDETLTNFAAKIADQQVKSISAVTDSFVKKLNQSTGDSFAEMRKVIEETSRLQEQSIRSQTAALERLENMTDNIQSIDRQSRDIISSLSGYITNVQLLQKELRDDYGRLSAQIEKHNELEENHRQLMADMRSYEHLISESAAALTESVRTVLLESDKINREISESSGVMKETTENVSTALEHSVSRTFTSLDENLTGLNMHLSETIRQIEETSGKVPDFVMTSYTGLESSFGEFQKKMEELIDTLNALQHKAAGGKKKRKFFKGLRSGE